MKVATNCLKQFANTTGRLTYGLSDCTLVKENKKTVLVKLAHDGSIIKRHKTKNKISNE